MEIYSAKWKSIQQNSIQQNSIQQNENLFSKTRIYSAKRESIHSAKRESIQQNGNLFSKTPGWLASERESIQSNGNIYSAKRLASKARCRFGQTIRWPWCLSFAILFSRYGWGGKRLVQVCYRYRQSCTETVKSILVSIGGSIEVTPTRLPAISLGEAAHNSEPFKSTCIPIWSLLPGGV